MSIRTHRRYVCLYIHYFLWNLVKSGLPWKFECFQSQFAMKILMFGKTKIWTDSVGKMISVYNILFRQDSFAVISFTHISAKISFHCLVHSPFKGFSTLYETIEKIINRKESYKWFQVGWIDNTMRLEWGNCSSMFSMSEYIWLFRSSYNGWSHYVFICSSLPLRQVWQGVQGEEVSLEASKIRVWQWKSISVFSEKLSFEI